MSGATSELAELLRQLQARRGGRGTAGAASRAPAAPGCALGDTNPGGPAVVDAPGTRAGPGAVEAAASLRAAAEAGAEALAAADADLARERAETAAGLRAEAPDPVRAGTVEMLPNGTRLASALFPDCCCSVHSGQGFASVPQVASQSSITTRAIAAVNRRC